MTSYALCTVEDCKRLFLFGKRFKILFWRHQATGGKDPFHNGPRYAQKVNMCDCFENEHTFDIYTETMYLLLCAEIHICYVYNVIYVYQHDPLGNFQKLQLVLCQN